MASVQEQLNPLFKPKSIAIIGASNDLTRWGGWVVDRPRRTGYTGNLYPVNPRESEIQGIKAFPNIKEIPDDIDLALSLIHI